MVSVWISVPLIGLMIVIIWHIVGMARWSGKVDQKLDDIMSQPAKWTTDLNAVAAAFRVEMAATVAALKLQLDAAASEVSKLRDERHKADGKIAMLEGALNEIKKTVNRVEERYDKIIDNGSGPVQQARQ